jgi:FtsH-binding integral membrane protein
MIRISPVEREDKAMERRERVRAGVRNLLGRVPLWVWTMLCLLIAAFYVVVWPQENAPSNPLDFRYIALRWFHPLAWLFLALSCASRMTRLSNKRQIANIIAFLALPSYALFFFAIISS